MVSIDDRDGLFGPSNWYERVRATSQNQKKQIQTKAIEQQTMNGSTKINKALG